MKKGLAAVKTTHVPSFYPLSFPRASKLHHAGLPQQFIQPYGVLQTALSHGQIVRAVPTCSQVLAKNGSREQTTALVRLVHLTHSSPAPNGKAGKHEPSTDAAASPNPVAGQKSVRVC